MTRIAPHTRAAARRLRREMTPAERRVWGRLREANRMLGTRFRRQAPIGAYIADFADLGRRLVIEIDGGQHGQGPTPSRDAARDAWLAAQGFRVLRFWNSDLTEAFDGVIDTILTEIVNAPHPSPPPEGEGAASGRDGATGSSRRLAGGDRGFTSDKGKIR